jgi:hypothetical protein
VMLLRLVLTLSKVCSLRSLYLIQDFASSAIYPAVFLLSEFLRVYLLTIGIEDRFPPEFPVEHVVKFVSVLRVSQSQLISLYQRMSHSVSGGWKLQSSNRSCRDHFQSTMPEVCLLSYSSNCMKESMFGTIHVYILALVSSTVQSHCG